MLSYDIAELRHLQNKEVRFINTYVDLIIGKEISSYNIEQLYELLTSIDISEYNYNKQKILIDIKHIVDPTITYSDNQVIIDGRFKLISLLEDPTIRHNISVINQYKLIIDLIRSKNNNLPDNILEQVIIYIESISKQVLAKDLINDLFKFADPNLFTALESAKLILGDQISHFKSTEIDCQIWHISCEHNNYEIGSICAFYNEDVPMIKDTKYGMMIQDVVKYPIPLLIQYLFPNITSIPKINTMLEIPINIVANSLNVDYIFVRPINNQSNILKKFYGYKELGIKLSYPCETISRGYDHWLYKEVHK